MRLTLPPSSDRLPELRHAAARELRGLPGEVVADVLLAMGEAVTNAIRHGSRGGQPVTVTLDVAGDWIKVTVLDRGPTPNVPRLPADPPAPMSPGGRGLWLILQLVDQVRMDRVGQGTLLSLRRRAESRAVV